MKTLRVIALLAVMSLVMAAPALAGDIGVYFDTDASVSTMYFELSTPFNVHVIMTDVNDVANAVEFQVNLPSQLIVLSWDYYPGSLTFFETPQMNAAGGVQVGLGAWIAMMPGLNENFVVLTMQCMSMIPLSDETITISGYPGASGAPEPRYNATGNVLTPMTTSDGTFNVSVDNEGDSWGSVKALYE